MESRAGQATEFRTGDSLENMLTPEQLPRNQYRPSLSPPAGEAEVAISGARTRGSDSSRRSGTTSVARTDGSEIHSSWRKGASLDYRSVDYDSDETEVKQHC